MAEDWVSGNVSASSVRTMRKKMYKHKDNLVHKKAVEIRERKKCFPTWLQL